MAYHRAVHHEDGSYHNVVREQTKTRTSFRVYGAVKGVTYRLFIPIKKRVIVGDFESVTRRRRHPWS